MTPFTRASLIAPLTAPLLYLVATLAGAAADPARRALIGQNLVGAAVIVFAFGAPVAYAATVGAGLPALWLIRRLGSSLTIGRTVLVGVVVGVGIAVALNPWLRGDLVSVPLAPWHGGLLGAATSAAWWWIAFRGAPARP
jgi:hypothetical protein